MLIQPKNPKRQLFQIIFAINFSLVPHKFHALTINSLEKNPLKPSKAPIHIISHQGSTENKNLNSTFFISIYFYVNPRLISLSNPSDLQH